MSETLKDYKYLIVILLILGVLFYWFQIRPAQIKSECSKDAAEFYRKLTTYEDSDGNGRISRDSIESFQARTKTHYEFCLHSNGI